LVVAPPQPPEQTSVEDAETLLRQALKRASLKDAVTEVAAATGLPRRQLYQRALALADQITTDKTEEAPHGAPR